MRVTCYWDGWRLETGSHPSSAFHEMCYLGFVTGHSGPQIVQLLNKGTAQSLKSRHFNFNK